MWVSGNVSQMLTSHGYYLDFTSNKSKGTSGMSSWGSITAQEVSLDRAMGSVVLGIVGHGWGVRSVRVLVHGSSVDLPVTEGYFLVPGDLTADISEKFTITLLDDWGKPFGAVNDLLASGTGAPTVTTAAIPKPDSAIPDCMASAVRNWPVQAVFEGVRAAALAYYKAKNLLPIRIYKDSKNVLNLVQQRAGFHWCNSGDGIIGGYEGQVPANAIAAVMVYVHHAPYLVVNASEHFLTMAMIPGKGWQVVGENTSP
jgi:hypothetical protein